MKRILIIGGVILLGITVIIFLFPVPTHLGLTLYDLNEHCNSDNGGYANYQDAPSCIETAERIKIMYATVIGGIILVIIGAVFPLKRKRND